MNRIETDRGSGSSDLRIPAAFFGVALAVALLSPGLVTPTVRGPVAQVLEPDRALDTARPRLAHVEPHLAVDSDDPRRLLVGTIVRSTERDGAWHCAVLSSSDGGDTWRRRDFEEMERCIDPWVLFTPGGARLFAALEIRDDVPHPGRFALLTWRSEDDGASWAGPGLQGHSHERPILVAEPDGDRIWAVSRRMHARPGGGEEHALGIMESSDDGRSFVDVSVQRPVALGMTPAGLVPGRDGELRVAFRDFAHGDHEPAVGAPRTWLLRSKDAGRTFAAPGLVTEACGPADAFPGYPALDGIGDHLVLACVRAGLDGLAVMRSTDGGTTWSAPVQVAAGALGEPAHVRTPMLAVADDGTVGLAWYDRRNDPDRRCQDVYFAASTNGGTTFGEPLRVSTETSCPDAPGNGSVADSWPMGGDYGALAGTAEGDFRIVWADSRTGVFQLRQATLGITGRGPRPGRAAASFRSRHRPTG